MCVELNSREADYKFLGASQGPGRADGELGEPRHDLKFSRETPFRFDCVDPIAYRQLASNSKFMMLYETCDAPM